MIEAEKNGIDDRGSDHPSDNQIKLVTETNSKQQGKIAWDLDEQAIQLGRYLRNYTVMAEGRELGMGAVAQPCVLQLIIIYSYFSAIFTSRHPQFSTF